eukprot:TRINITY_DN17192_c0_g1_i2.p2 TRINITY_DN17192_c0_g1~~TRINITY_DN17192_c0_g1_i2.p2  ORF type:complete len:239 (+),score=21.14 TRINITY_DN17192_c0_g1_i2:1185-1901(+)
MSVKDRQELADSVKAQSIAISHDEKHFAVGFKDGSLAVVDVDKWAMIYKDKECKARISDIKFSSDNTLLAIASHDTLIQVYEFPSMNKRATLSGHSSYVRHLDWSTDSKSLRSTSGNEEVLFWNAEAGSSVASGGAVYRDEVWDTCTCTFGWDVQGAFNRRDAVCSCDRSPGAEPCQLLAVGDDKGRVRMFRYPCIAKAECKEGKGHAGHVVSVKFTANKHLLSVGGSDKCVFQWLIK